MLHLQRSIGLNEAVKTIALFLLSQTNTKKKLSYFQFVTHEPAQRQKK
jgi:hypothetical protein